MKFIDNKSRKMSIEEMIDYCKTLFSDRNFIDMVAKFCVEDGDREKLKIRNVQNQDENKEALKENENSYTIYISCDKINLL